MFGKTISAICTTLVTECSGPAALSDGRLNRTEAFVHAQIRDMPDFLRVALMVLLGVFNLVVLATSWHTFRGLPQFRRQQVLARWRCASLAPMQDFVRLFETLVLYSQLESEK